MYVLIRNDWTRQEFNDLEQRNKSRQRTFQEHFRRNITRSRHLSLIYTATSTIINGANEIYTADAASPISGMINYGLDLATSRTYTERWFLVVHMLISLHKRSPWANYWDCGSIMFSFITPLIWAVLWMRLKASVNRCLSMKTMDQNWIAMDIMIHVRQLGHCTTRTECLLLSGGVHRLVWFVEW